MYYSRISYSLGKLLSNPLSKGQVVKSGRRQAGGRFKLHLVFKFLAFVESFCLTFSEYLRFTQSLDAARVSPGWFPPLLPVHWETALQ